MDFGGVDRGKDGPKEFGVVASVLQRAYVERWKVGHLCAVVAERACVKALVLIHVDELMAGDAGVSVLQTAREEFNWHAWLVF